MHLASATLLAFLLWGVMARPMLPAPPHRRVVQSTVDGDESAVPTLTPTTTVDLVTLAPTNTERPVLDGPTSVPTPESVSAPAVPGGTCENGEWRCTGTSTERCNHGSWVIIADCAAQGLVCNPSGGCTWSAAALQNAAVTHAPAPPVSFPDPTGDTATPSIIGASTVIAIDTSLLDTGTTGLSVTTPVITATSDPSPSIASDTSLQITAAPPLTSAGAPISGNGNGTRSSPAPIGDFTAPHFVIYTDLTQDPWPRAADLVGYNRFILAFWQTTTGPFDNALVWTKFSQAERRSYLDDYHAAGMALMVAAFGEKDKMTSMGLDPVRVATDLAAYVKEYELDGVDCDWEDIEAMNGGKGEAWVIAFQTELRRLLPRPYLITHAPVAPWFGGTLWPGGAYKAIHAAVGDGIDWYNVQFYNQGEAYTTCEDLITTTSGHKGTSVLEIHSAAGVPLDKIVLGKPLIPGKAGSGYMPPAMINTCAQQARSKGWNGGLMFWELLPEAVEVIAAARGSW